jgi:uncharacterized protein (DUF2236 family)
MLPFTKGSMAWRVNMEPVIGLGGGRALLLQVLHPLVAAGVEQHSTFAQDPFRRGFRTADIMLKLAFGDPHTSRHQAEILRRMHDRVKGTAPDGTPYDAMDPALLLWVWATLLDVSIRIYERAVHPLTDDERERYYQEQLEVAYACGVPEGGCPPSYNDFVAYFDRVVEHDLRVTLTARRVAYAAAHPPLPWPLRRLTASVATFFTAGLLPAAYREPLGYTWTRRDERRMRAFFAISRALSRVVPRPVRHLPNRYLINRKTPLGLWRGRAIEFPDELSVA